MEPIKEAVVRLMNRAVADYLRRNNVKIIAVAGSIGKTSTVNAVRTVLSHHYRVHIPNTTYNTNRSVHLELFDLPFATSTTGWAKTVAQVLWRSRGKASYQVVVIEIGTDHPGELQSFAWLKPHIGVLTAIAPEHMEHFGTLDAVAEEELSMANFCDLLAFNANTVPQQYVSDKIDERVLWYGHGSEISTTHYRIEHNTVKADFNIMGHVRKDIPLQVLGEHSLDALLASAAVATLCDEVQLDEVIDGIKAVQPVKGRMQRLEGIKDAIIIDDSYNASPEAVKAALDVLGSFEASQRIAVLGMMNEMGDYSPKAHREVGGYCDPASLDIVITIGKDANDYLAKAARKQGCTVESFDSPYRAGEYIKRKLKPGAVLLFKGSQNGVFAEEAVKAVLKRKTDETKLTRQSAYWMDIKRRQFDDAPRA